VAAQEARALVVALALGCGAATAPPPAAAGGADASLSAATAWLWSRQAADGGWHSETYGLLRSGQSLTAFVLDALRQVPAEVYRPAERARARAEAFLAGRVDADGALGRADPSLEDYPNYATALGLRCLGGSAVHGGLAPRMEACLRRQQFWEKLGWVPADAPYGGWGMGGPTRVPPEPGHVDLSMTRHVLEGLAAAGARPGDPAFRRAAAFLHRCRNPDGGFSFSPVVEDANKAGRDGDRFRSYGTATADGLLSLLASGVAPSDPAAAAATVWLIRHHRSDRVPGFPEGSGSGWDLGMVHYYRAAAARAFRAAGVEEAPRGADWRADLARAIAADLRPDGSLANPSFLMKEDDPLVATAFAVQALVAARR